MGKFKIWLFKEWKETKLLFKGIPAIAFAFFAISIVVMNLLANKLIVNESWIALDAGIIISWVAFLMGDMLVKRFGPKASIKITLAALAINLVIVGLFNIAAAIPGEWGEGANEALNNTISGSWHVLLASTTAFVVAMLLDTFLNWTIYKRFKNRTGFGAYAVSSYASTTVGQFIDNLIFALLFTHMNGWITLTAAVMMAFTGALVELLCQIIFSPLGYKIAEKWRKDGIGKEYVEATEEGRVANSIK